VLTGGAVVVAVAGGLARNPRAVLVLIAAFALVAVVAGAGWQLVSVTYHLSPFLSFFLLLGGTNRERKAIIYCFLINKQKRIKIIKQHQQNVNITPLLQNQNDDVS
jgi:hypothetical protein